MLSLAVKNENDKAYDVYLKEMEPQRETVNQLIEDIQTLNALLMAFVPSSDIIAVWSAVAAAFSAFEEILPANSVIPVITVLLFSTLSGKR